MTQWRGRCGVWPAATPPHLSNAVIVRDGYFVPTAMAANPDFV
jgi:hypothetical protein